AGGVRGQVSAHPRDAVILGYVRTPFGRYGGGLAPIRPDDLASHVIRAVLERTDVGDDEIDEVIFGASNQSGEDNRNVGRMAALLAGLPETVPGVTVNRLCGRGLADTTLGWRLVNPRMVDLGYHPVSLGETAENVSVKEHVSRAEQDAYAARSQERYARAKAEGFFGSEIQAVHNGRELVLADEHPRPDSTVEKLAKLKPAFREGGSV